MWRQSWFLTALGRCGGEMVLLPQLRATVARGTMAVWNVSACFDFNLRFLYSCARLKYLLLCTTKCYVFSSSSSLLGGVAAEVAGHRRPPCNVSCVQALLSCSSCSGPSCAVEDSQRKRIFDIQLIGTGLASLHSRLGETINRQAGPESSRDVRRRSRCWARLL